MLAQVTGSLLIGQASSTSRKASVSCRKLVDDPASGIGSAHMWAVASLSRRAHYIIRVCFDTASMMLLAPGDRNGEATMSSV